MVSNTRLYGASIAIISGVYSLWSASLPADMVPAAWLMALLGIVVIVHGVVLLTPYVDALGATSGPLMIAYAVAMLLVQAGLALDLLDDGAGMMMNGGMGASPMTAGTGWDAGMVALAVLMLLSGVIMSQGQGSRMDASGM